MVLVSLWTCEKPFAAVQAADKWLGTHILEQEMKDPRLLEWLTADCPAAWSYLIRCCCAPDPRHRPARPFRTLLNLLDLLELDILGTDEDFVSAFELVDDPARPPLTCARLPGVPVIEPPPVPRHRWPWLRDPVAPQLRPLLHRWRIVKPS